jgi:hypothetical protein
MEPSHGAATIRGLCCQEAIVPDLPHTEALVTSIQILLIARLGGIRHPQTSRVLSRAPKASS